MRLGEVHLKPNILKSLLLFVSLTILIQFFYAVSTQTSFFSATQYLPVGYAIHLSYYLLFLAVTFLFVGNFDFGAIGIKRTAPWKKFLFIALALALLGATLKVVLVQGTFSEGFYSVPYYVLVPAFLALGILIGLAEELAFRGYILRNLLDSYGPTAAILLSSLLFGIYHINILDFNYYTAPFWFLYVVQAFTGGLVMATLFYKTNRNLIGSITYHSSNIILGQIILWTPQATVTYLLGVETVINLILLAILRFLPTKWIDKNAGSLPFQ